MDILKNKAYLDYEFTSRYSTFPYYYNTIDKKYVYGTTAYLDDTTQYVLREVEEGDTPDNLSLKYYGTPLFYWMILDFNRIQDPFEQLEVGSKLKIPVITSLRFNI